MGFKSHIKKKTPGLIRVCPGHGLTRQAGLNFITRLRKRDYLCF